MIAVFGCSFAYGLDGSRRVALVIGNSAYKMLTALANPANDVRDVAKTLRIAGFDMTIGSLARDFDAKYRWKASVPLDLLVSALQGLDEKRKSKAAVDLVQSDIDDGIRIGFQGIYTAP